VTLPALIGRLALEFDAAPALESTEATLSYRALAIRCNQYRAGDSRRACVPGTTVGLMMPNWTQNTWQFGWVLRASASLSPLINNNLAGDALVHSISIVAAACGHRRQRTWHRGWRLCAHAWSPDLSCWVYGDGTRDLAPLAPALARLSGDELRDSEYMPPRLDATGRSISTHRHHRSAQGSQGQPLTA